MNLSFINIKYVHMYGMPKTCLSVLILDNFVSQGTLGIQSRNEAKALLIDCVLLRSFLLLPTP